MYHNLNQNQMDKRTQFNLGESGKTSVKVHHNPGGQSNWSLGWDNETKPKMPIQKYHNESHLMLGGQNEQLDQEEQRKRLEEKKKKEEELNNNLPTFDPKMGGKGTFQFGQENVDHNMAKLRNPPGGKSNIQFG